MGIRDQAILETLYSTGIRRLELINLKPSDFDEVKGTVLIREGKGGKDRLIPVGERSLKWIRKYRDEVRIKVITEPDEAPLFLNNNGIPMKPSRLTQMTKRYIDSAGLGKSGSCHIFRHSMATIMLEGFANIHYIQAILGHPKLETTQVYTKVSITKLKEIHEKTHPGVLSRIEAKLKNQNELNNTSI